MDLQDRMEKGVPYCKLTPREVQVLQGIIDGLCNRAIADKIGIERGTVSVHTSRLYKRLGVHNRAEAMHWGQKYIAMHDKVEERAAELRSLHVPDVMAPYEVACSILKWNTFSPHQKEHLSMLLYNQHQ